MRRHRSAVGFREDGPFVGAALDIGRNLLASTKLGSLSRKNLSQLEDVTLVEEVLRPGVAGEIFDSMAQWSCYGFPKAHGVCHANITIQAAYLGCHYPQEFMAAVQCCGPATVAHEDIR